MDIGLGTRPIRAMHHNLALARHPLDQNTASSVHLAHPVVLAKNGTSQYGCPTTT